MSEKLRFKKGAAQGCHVDGRKGLARSRAGQMNGFGQQFFTGPAFPRNQYRYIASGMKFRFFQYFQQSAGLGDDGFERFNIIDIRQCFFLIQI